MNRKLIAAAIALCAACGPAAKAAPPPGVRAAEDLAVDTKYCPKTKLEPGDFRYCGYVNTRALAEIRERIASGGKRLILTSPGGAEDIAIEITKELERSKVGLIVERFCLSACAHFMFLPSATVSVRDGTLVAFHQTAVASVLLRARPDAPDGERFRSVALASVNQEVRFFAERSLSPLWLTEPLFRMRPTCLARELDWSNPEYPAVYFKADYTYWVPSREMLEKLGKGVNGYWPDTPEKVKELAGSLSDLPLGTLHWLGPVGFSDTPKGIDKIPFC